MKYLKASASNVVELVHGRHMVVDNGDDDDDDGFLDQDEVIQVN